MSKKRIITRLDIKNDHVIKGIHLEGLRKVGKPNELAKKYYERGSDEIIFMDAVASYYDRNSLYQIIENACEEIFVPLTVGGGIRKIEDIQNLLNVGADKVAINTQAVKNHDFISESSKLFGSQCIVSQVDAKKIGLNRWEVYTDNGREPSGIDLIDWVKKVEKLGAGEILLTSIDMEGTKNGFDIELYESVVNEIKIPVIASGGMGKLNDATEIFKKTDVDAIAVASVLHYQINNIGEIKEFFKK